MRPPNVPPFDQPESGYFDPGEARATKVQHLFTRIATRYDWINDLQSIGLHRVWKRRLVESASINPGAQVLDVCCGTGDLCFEFAARGAHVTGLDFTPSMLDQARLRHQAHHNSQIAFVEGDAMALPFDEGRFDVVSVAYGLRNLCRWEQGLREMHRVLRPGGTLLVLDFGKPDLAWWRACYFAYLKLVVPIFGWAFAGDAHAYQYILESLHHYPAQRGIEKALIKLGCIDIQTHSILGHAMTLQQAQKAD